MSKIPMVAVPNGVRVYDSGPDYFDRFTVIFQDGCLLLTTDIIRVEV